MPLNLFQGFQRVETRPKQWRAGCADPDILVGFRMEVGFEQLKCSGKRKDINCQILPLAELDS